MNDPVNGIAGGLMSVGPVEPEDPTQSGHFQHRDNKAGQENDARDGGKIGIPKLHDPPEHGEGLGFPGNGHRHHGKDIGGNIEQGARGDEGPCCRKPERIGHHALLDFEASPRASRRISTKRRSKICWAKSVRAATASTQRAPSFHVTPPISRSFTTETTVAIA